ncbi:capsid protein [Burkholderia stagnalis]|uniref:major capsid protein n=1 Tax=Burkholderia stagnalis TaxID=1503054 RepID=UPI00075E6D20|nr:major capsid protein [Burkholderia stagnalis]KVZ18634.1 capsid protein [Burkholderia stagnalis]KWN32857.1 capsid protein [Burkholderia stagnalis]KWN44684.1 capsid protein [Burkholderia stagnalis]KWN54417.1 capsid protein [Burkholderia stagnalis]KWO68824.1 capsid protein [Burkholderia stagnalis]
MTSLVYDTNTLIQVVPNLKLSQNFLLDLCFPNIVLADSEEVSIDVDVGKRRMAPFVSPLVEGKLVEQRRYQTNTFKPAYIKDKRAPDLRKPVRRMIGERIGGELTGAQREMANLEAELTDQIDILNRRLEWMAAQALQTGTVTVKGEGFDTVVVDFGRDPSLTIALTAAAQWTAANIGTETNPGTVAPTDNITDWAQLILKKSGAQVTDIIFTTKAFRAFKLDYRLKGAIVFPAQAPFGNQVNPAVSPVKGAIYMGRWGSYDLWVYSDWYVDDNDVEQPMIPDGGLIMSGPDMMGTRAFGQIMDPKFSYQAMPYAPKTWVEEDPAQRLILMQSAPLVIPSRVNACLYAKVA